MEPCPFARGCAARQTLLQRSHSADSTTDRRSISQLLPGAPGTPRVVALGMSSPVTLVCRTRIRPQIVIRALYFCRYTGSCRKRRREIKAILGQTGARKISVKNYMSYKILLCWCRLSPPTPILLWRVRCARLFSQEKLMVGESNARHRPEFRDKNVARAIICIL